MTEAEMIVAQGGAVDASVAVLLGALMVIAAAACIGFLIQIRTRTY